MGTTVQKLQRILETKTGFKDLITEKGGVITETTTFHEYIDEARKLMEGGKVVVEEASATTVPNEGYVENIYFNTNLISEEVDKIITDANLEWFKGTAVQPGSPSMNLYFIAHLTSSENSWLPIFIIDYASVMSIPDGSVAYVIMVGEVPIYVSSSVPDGPAGWCQEAFDLLEEEGIIIHGEANATCNLGSITNNVDAPVGLQNEALKQIFSITPFSAGKQPVPNSGYVESIKFNTSLTPEEVDKIITDANLSGVDVNGAKVYMPFVGPEHICSEGTNHPLVLQIVDFAPAMNSDVPMYMITLANGADDYIIYASESTHAFDSGVPNGWYDFSEHDDVMPVRNNPIPVASNATSDYEGVSVGAQNDKLVDLFYIDSEPFRKELTGTYEAVTTDITENGKVDLTTY